MKVGFIILFTVFAIQNSSAQSLRLKTPVNFLALGDSYTIGQEVGQSGSWPYQLNDSLRASGVEVESIKVVARTGWRTDNLMSAIEEERLKSDYNLVSVLIGVNNQFQGAPLDQYKKDFKFLLGEAIRFANYDTSSVFVLSIPDYGYTPYGEGDLQNISPEIDKFNQANRQITNDFGVIYFDITPSSRRGLDEPDLVAGDGLHPSERLYSEWVGILMDTIRKYNELSNIPISEPDTNSSQDPNQGMTFFTVNEFSELILYPNPVESNLNIAGEGIISFKLFNLQGAELVSIKFVKDSKQRIIDLSDISRGTYIIQLTTSDGKQITERIIKI